jgi:PAS domain S-box-containing protein
MELLPRLRLPTASLHTKLTVTLAILVVVVTAGSVTFLIERERAERLHRLEERATRIADLLEQSLAQELWNVDSKAIQRQLNALAPNPELAEVTVTAVGYGTVASAGPRNISDATGGIVRVRPITYADVEGLSPQTIGEVTVILTRAEAEAAIARARWVILAMAGAVVLTLYAATSVLLNRLLRTPITRLEAMVDRLAAGDLDARCPVDSADELGRLAERVNVMADRLRGSTVHLRESETRFRTFVDHATDSFFLHDDQLTVLDVNRQACESLGYSRDELISMHPRDFDVGLDEASLARLAERVGAGETVTFESLHRRKDGTVFPVEIRARQQGEHRVRLSLVRDITERKRADAELRASEERFRTLVQFSFDVYWETDAQHRFTRQDFAENLAEAPAPGSEIGKTRWEVPYLEPDEEAWRKHRATLDAHLPFRDFELARPTPDGDKRYVSVSGLPVFDETGRFIGYRGVGQHITDRKRSEQALRQSQAYLAEAQRLTHTGSWAYRPATGKVTYWSDEAFRIFGLDPRRVSLPEWEELVRLVHSEDREGLSEPIAGAVRERDFAHDCRIVLPDGMVRHLHAVGHPVLDKAGNLAEYFGTVVDVTDRKRADDEHRAHVWFLESMDRINRAMQGTNDVERMMSDVLDAVLEMFACDRAWLLYPCDPDAPSWRAVMEHTRPEFPGAAALGPDLPMSADSAEVARATRLSRGALLVGPGHERQVKPQMAERFGVRSEMLMALHPKGDKPYLFGLHQCSRPRSWTKEEQRLFEEIGHRLTDALSSLVAFRSLRESERKLEEAQRISHVGYWERDLATNRYTWSDETYRIHGLRPRERIQSFEDMQAIVHPADREIRAAAVAEALRGARRYDMEYRVVRPDGTVRVVHSQGDVTWDESGRPLRQFGVMQDITELRRAEDELRASEARFRTFVDHATDAWFLHDEHQTVIDVNRQGCESLGYSREELIGMRPRDFDAGLDKAFIARVGERVTAGETVTFETLHRRKDEGVFPVEIRIRRFQQGERVLHLALVRDISERKRAEQRTFTQHAVAQILAEAATIEEATPRILQAVCEFLDWDLGTLWRVDRDAGVLRCVQVWHKPSLDAGPFEAATRETAFAHGVGLPGRVWASRVPASIPDVAFDPTFLRAGEAARAGLHAAFAFPILLGGEVLGVTDFFSRDVRQADQDLLDMMASLGSQIGQFIERKRAEDALRIAQSNLTHLARVMTMGELTASIAHEVNQPLLGIVSSASSCSRWLAAQPPNLQRAQRALERIMEAGTRASAVIDRVRTLVKREPLRAAPVDLNEIALDVIAMVRHELQRSGVSLKTRLAEELPAVPGDRVQLQQVVLNLILNAIEATREIEGRSRQVWVASRFERGTAVHVEVRDSGVGLPPDSQARVFEAFYTTKQSGLGMGLSISRSIIEAHGGRISARPNSPDGAIFQFSLPLVSEDTGVA